MVEVKEKHQEAVLGLLLGDDLPGGLKLHTLVDEVSLERSNLYYSWGSSTGWGPSLVCAVRH
jgi:hypothetical protein